MKPDTWYEVRLVKGATPTDFYEQLAEWPWSAHHFWNEPWWPRAYVIRILTDERPDGPLIDHVVKWDDAPDAEYFGQYWPWAQRFFEASSILAGGTPSQLSKLTHCLANAHGVDGWAEIRWHLRIVARMLLMSVRWKLYLRRRWERDVGPPVKAA